MSDSDRSRNRDWGRALDLFQTVAIVAGILFGVMELTQFRTEQSRQMQLELARSINTPEVFDALFVVLSFEDTLSAERVAAEIEAHESEVLFFMQTLETIGILVYQGDLDIQVVDEFFGGIVVGVWERVSPWVYQERGRLEQPHFVEWVQWLAERLGDYRTATGTPPAYEAYSDWVPPR